ncbi:MAG TPA: DUF86 domain-containing protein, partial [Methanosarcinales archaeon]|nr:DUF86 domain-containing protein [Methanosarcinales archaeon]
TFPGYFRLDQKKLKSVSVATKNPFLNQMLPENLKRANGLRNVLVHEYNGIDDLLAFESVREFCHHSGYLAQW